MQSYCLNLTNHISLFDSGRNKESNQNIRNQVLHFVLLVFDVELVHDLRVSRCPASQGQSRRQGYHRVNDLTQ